MKIRYGRFDGENVLTAEAKTLIITNITEIGYVVNVDIISDN